MRILFFTLFLLFSLGLSPELLADQFGFTEILESGQSLDIIETKIKRKYRSLAFRYHPDRSGPQANQKKFVDMKAAFDQVIKKLESRKQVQSRPRSGSAGNFSSNKN